MATSHAISVKVKAEFNALIKKAEGIANIIKFQKISSWMKKVKNLSNIKVIEQHSILV